MKTWEKLADIHDAIRKFIGDRPSLHESIYGKPMTRDINPRILAMYNKAVATGDAILLETKEDYHLMMCEWDFQWRANHFDVRKEYDYQGNEILGTFEPKIFGTEIPTGGPSVAVKTTVIFLPSKPMHVTREQMSQVKSLMATVVRSIEGKEKVCWNDAEIIEVEDGQRDIDKTLPINDANGIRLRTQNH